jgi:hypothetical protein
MSEEPITVKTRGLSGTEVKAVHGHVRLTTGHWPVEYTKEQALELAEAIVSTANNAGPVPVWEHSGVTYDLTQTWRSTRPWTGWHWRWTGEYTPDGVPLMTPVGTGDEDLIGSTTPFDQVLAQERLQQGSRIQAREDALFTAFSQLEERDVFPEAEYDEAEYDVEAGLRRFHREVLDAEKTKEA